MVGIELYFVCRKGKKFDLRVAVAYLVASWSSKSGISSNKSRHYQICLPSRIPPPPVLSMMVKTEWAEWCVLISLKKKKAVLHKYQCHAGSVLNHLRVLSLAQVMQTHVCCFILADKLGYYVWHVPWLTWHVQFHLH